MGAATAGVHSLCVFVPKDQNKMTFECVSSLENQDYCERSVHLSVSPPAPPLARRPCWHVRPQPHAPRGGSSNDANGEQRGL